MTHDLNDKDLKQSTHDAAISLSYYNAAEGQSYRQEQGARGKAYSKFHTLKKECEERDLDWKQRDKSGRVIGYLI